MKVLKGMTRIKKLMDKFNEKVAEFGSPERSFQERQRMLKQLRDMEQEMDEYYNITEE